jgi:hypothetical protein
MSWLWWGLAAWIAFDIVAAGLWARHRSREKRHEAIRTELRVLGHGHALDAYLTRDHRAALAGRRRIVQAALDHIPPQTRGPRRTEEDK